MARRTISEDARLILAGEVNATDLAKMFEMNVSNVRAKLVPLKPVRTENNTSIYRFRDAAAYLSKLPEDVVSQVLRINHMDLPPMLRKEYWTGQMQMLKVKELQGELFRVDTVIEYVGELMKVFRMSLLLMRDQVERETTFSTRQQDVLTALVDQTLEATRAEAVRIFNARINDAAGRSSGDDDMARIEELAKDL